VPVFLEVEHVPKINSPRKKSLKKRASNSNNNSDLQSPPKEMRQVSTTPEKVKKNTITPV